jgi:hypothetical protein
MRNHDRQQAPIDPIYAQEPGEVARITISLFGNGGVRVSGNIGDERLAKQMIDAARDSVTSHHAKTRGRVLVPGNTADVSQDRNFPFGPVCPT